MVVKVDLNESPVKTELSYVKDEVKGLKGELSTNPIRAEFNQLKEIAECHQPIN
jgi:hypothetical protein